MKAQTKLLWTLVTLIVFPLPLGLRADQQYSPAEVPEACARAAAPRALQTFHWLICAPEKRATWASSTRIKKPDTVAPPRFFEQLPPETIVESKPAPGKAYLVRTTYSEFQRRQMTSRPPSKAMQLTQLRRNATGRGGAAQLMDFTN
jgi:hypothetical protein